MTARKKLLFLNNIIEKYGLRPASKRYLSLFTMSCVAVAYNKLLKKILAFLIGPWVRSERQQGANIYSLPYLMSVILPLKQRKL